MRYEQAEELYFKAGVDYVPIVTDAGTSVTVEWFSGVDWVADPLSPVTGVQILKPSGLIARFTPDTGGFFLGEEERL